MTASPEQIYTELVCPGFSHIAAITSQFQIYIMFSCSVWIVTRNTRKHILPKGFKPVPFCSTPIVSTGCKWSTHPLLIFLSSTVLRKGLALFFQGFLFVCLFCPLPSLRPAYLNIFLFISFLRQNVLIQLQAFFTCQFYIQMSPNSITF